MPFNYPRFFFYLCLEKEKEEAEEEKKRNIQRHDLAFGQKEHIKRTNEKRDQVLFYRLLFNRKAKTKEKRESVKEKDLSNTTRRNKYRKKREKTGRRRKSMSFF